MSLIRHIFGTFLVAFYGFDMKTFYTTTSIRFSLDIFINFSKDKCKISLIQGQGEYDDWRRIDESRFNSICHLIFAMCIDVDENNTHILMSCREPFDMPQL